MVMTASGRVSRQADRGEVVDLMFSTVGAGSVLAVTGSVVAVGTASVVVVASGASEAVEVVLASATTLLSTVIVAGVALFTGLRADCASAGTSRVVADAVGLAEPAEPHRNKPTPTIIVARMTRQPRRGA
jgi:hypothetical protein